MIRLDLRNPDMAISLKFALSHSLLSPAPCMLNRNFLIFVLKDALLIFGEYNPGSLDIISVYNIGPLKNTDLL